MASRRIDPRRVKRHAQFLIVGQAAALGVVVLSGGGTVAMVYDGIKLSGGGMEKDRTLGKLFSVAINALVRNNSSGAQGKERVGTFAFERQRDRSIFNYLWSGLREGSKSMLLPKVMTK